ncbi:HD domain-containing protein [Amycolatopsis sp. OK19-0408]|uniref:HD domain-containing protein n=1 Tax=Amycolatopsis iheyensis TaxID=2945988 RepID=A0A9X2NHU9_9PSEU|nr:HD domain-containing protein [Amycolatopsis iheyensis]MCR6485070.1 HD domain-containing protein [Amycolatopsis iheyensis]
MDLTSIALPDSPAAGHAVEVATTYSSPAMLNHSMRVYAWAVALGAVHHVEFDAELLFVAAMLHDVGLVAEFDSHTRPFEVAGGHVAWVFAAGAGWPAARRTRLAEVIVRHMLAEVDPAEDPEGFLLSRAAALDIAGRDVTDVPAGLRGEVLARYPRLTLVDEFLRCFHDQAARKPESTAGAAIRNDLDTRMRRNPLDQD